MLKLADFGLGGVAAARAAVRSRIGTSTVDYLSLADQASLFRGAGTPLYMSPEQRRGASPDPRHDLYALGVVWYQLLVGDVSRELHHGWAKELAVRFGVPGGHVGLIERCVGWFDERPKDAAELLPLLREAGESAASPGRKPGGATPDTPGLTPGARPEPEEGLPPPTLLNASQATPVPSALADGRRRGLAAALARLTAAYADLDGMKHWRFNTTARNGFLLGLLVGWLVGEFVYAVGVGSSYFPSAFRAPYFDWLSVVLGCGAGLAAWVGYVWLIRVGVQGVATDLRQKAENQVSELADDFPAEVASWGGRSALRHPPTVRQLRDELDPSARPPAPPTAAFGADDLAADPTRKAVLVARLKEHDGALDGANDAATYSWVGLVFGLWLVAAPAAGVAAYQLAHEPGYDPARNVATAGNQTAAVAAAMAAGAAVAGLSWVLMAAVRATARRKAAAAGDRLAADYPRLVDAWGGRPVLDSRETVAALINTLDPKAADGRGWLRRLLGG